MKKRYCVGRILGRWTNLLPPIQGGIYRKMTDETLCENEIDATNSSSLSSSSDNSPRSISPFEITGVRSRSHEGGFSSSESISSMMSSIEEDNGMAHLDSVTREKINLDLEKYPSLDHTTQDEIVAKYRLLKERITAEGLYQCNYKAYAVELCRYSLLFSGMLLCLHWGWYALGGVFMGAFWQQLVFIAHDAGHMGITHDFHTDTLIGIFIADFMGGLSMGWWKRTHNVHHIVTSTSRLRFILEAAHPGIPLFLAQVPNIIPKYKGQCGPFFSIYEVLLRSGKYHYPSRTLRRNSCRPYVWSIF